MKGKFFLDTNVFIYSFDDTEPLKQKRASQLISRALEGKKGIISFQVVQEFINIALKIAQNRMSIESAQLYYQKILMPLCEVQSHSELYANAFSIHKKLKISWYGSIIVAAAVLSESEILYTEDLQHGRSINGVTIKNPFAK